MFKEKYPIQEQAKDFTMESDGNSAVLFIHGFTGSPHHFRSYAHYFHQHGIYVRAMRLPGHGSHYEDLMEVTYLDWRLAVWREIKSLHKLNKKVFLIGYSFGGNLALDAAMHYPGLVTGIITISTPIFLKKERSLRFLTNFYNKYTNVKVKKKPWNKRPGVDGFDDGAYTHMPIKSALDFFEFIDHFSKPHLDDVKAPILILHSDKDPLVSYKSGQYIYDKVSSKEKELITFNGYKKHTIESDEIKKSAYKKALEFIKKH